MANELSEAGKTQRTRARAAKTRHDLHVGLLMHEFGLAKPDAIALAYVEGLMGLDDRLPKKPLTVK